MKYRRVTRDNAVAKFARPAKRHALSTFHAWILQAQLRSLVFVLLLLLFRRTQGKREEQTQSNGAEFHGAGRETSCRRRRGARIGFVGIS